MNARGVSTKTWTFDTGTALDQASVARQGQQIILHYGTRQLTLTNERTVKRTTLAVMPTPGLDDNEQLGDDVVTLTHHGKATTFSNTLRLLNADGDTVPTFGTGGSLMLDTVPSTVDGLSVVAARSTDALVGYQTTDVDVQGHSVEDLHLLRVWVSVAPVATLLSATAKESTAVIKLFYRSNAGVVGHSAQTAPNLFDRER